MRLVKVSLQCWFVIDDGTDLQELEGNAILISGKDWESYPEQLRADMLRIEQEINAGGFG